jgi:hypothetical protein
LTVLSAVAVVGVCTDRALAWKPYMHNVTADEAYQNRTHVPHDENRLLRVFGNHDDLWAHAGRVEKFFRSDFPRLVIYEALRYDVVDGDKMIGELVLAHGHQGSSAADRTGFGRLAVRFGYRRLQRAWNVSANTPARDYALRGVHDRRCGTGRWNRRSIPRSR